MTPFAKGTRPPQGRAAYFSLGALGLPVNVIAVVWGLFVVTNISWPRAGDLRDHPWGRFAAPLATLSLIACGCRILSSLSAKADRNRARARRRGKP